MSKEQIINKMKELLIEAINADPDINYNNFHQKYVEASNELEYEEHEEGEHDLANLIYYLGDEFYGLKHELVKVLEKEGLSKEQRIKFYKKTFTTL